VKKTRIRKKAKGLGILHCTGRDEEDARERRMPSASLAVPPGAILPGSAGRNMREKARPSGILSVTVVPTVFLRSVPAFLPGQASEDPRSSGNARDRRGHPFRPVQRRKREGEGMKADSMISTHFLKIPH